MEEKKAQAKNPDKKKITKPKIVLVSILGLFVVLLIGGYLVIQGYLGKIDYDSGVREIVSEIGADDGPSGTSDSPRSAVDMLEAQVRENLESNSQPIENGDDVLNIMLMGGDARVSGGRCRSDTMILISINKATSKIIMTSLMRDIYLQIPGVELGNRLNAANAFGGPALLLKTVEQNFKIRPDRYIFLDFFTFVDIIDRLEGVTIDISEAERKVANGYIGELNRLAGVPAGDGLIEKAGEQVLSGKQALSFARIRYVGNADFERTDRQREVLGKMFEKIKRLDIFKLNALLNVTLPKVTTDFSKGELYSLILSLPTLSGYSTDYLRIPVDGSYRFMTVRRMSVLGIDFAKNIQAMKNKISGNSG